VQSHDDMRSLLLQALFACGSPHDPPMPEVVDATREPPVWGGSDADVDTDSDTDTAPAICDEFGEAVRGPLEGCCAMDAADVQDRVDALRDWCIEKHRIESTDIDPVLARECLEEMRSDYESCRFTLSIVTHGPCEDMQIGLVGEGGHCWLDLECVDGLVCAPVVFDGVDVSGLCLIPPGEGEPCAGSRCAEGLFCDRVPDEDGTCRRLVSPGGDCATLVDEPLACGEDFYCDGAVCVARGAPGEPCDASAPCAWSLRCNPDSLVCERTSSDGAACIDDAECAAGCCAADATCGRSLCDPLSC